MGRFAPPRHDQCPPLHSYCNTPVGRYCSQRGYCTGLGTKDWKLGTLKELHGGASYYLGLIRFQYDPALSDSLSNAAEIGNGVTVADGAGFSTFNSFYRYVFFCNTCYLVDKIPKTHYV